jgi:AcrR family transcriptional regulator
MAKERAFRRLGVDERRHQLLMLGTELFAQHSYDELSMRRIASAAGISHPLLYRYFPTKQSYFRATLEQAAEVLRARTMPDPSLHPQEQLKQSLEAFVELVDENALAYKKLMESVTSAPEVRGMVDEIRSTTAVRILNGLFPGGAPTKARAVVTGWLWFMDGVLLDWIDQRDLEREDVSDLLLNSLFAALGAAGATPEGRRVTAATARDRD